MDEQAHTLPMTSPTAGNPAAALAFSPPDRSLPVELEVRQENELLSPAYRDEWNDLAAASETNTITQTFEWNYRWWQELSGGRALVILTLWRDGRRIAIVPLMQSRIRLLGIPLTGLEFLSMRQADYADVIARADDKPAVATAVLRYLAGHRESWDLLHLKHVPEYSSTIAAFKRSAASERRYAAAGVSAKCPSHVFRYDSPNERSFMKRKDIDRHYKALKKIGPVEFVNFETPAEALAQLPAFFAQHVKRRAGLPDQSSYERESNRRFIQSLTGDVAASGWLAFSGLSVGGKIAAYHYGFRYNNFLMYYKPAFEMDMGKHSPGLVLLKSLYEWCMDRGLSELDFTIGDEMYKTRFANLTRSNGEILIARHTLCALALRLSRTIRAARERTKAFLKSVPAAARFFQKLRTAHSSIRNFMAR